MSNFGTRLIGAIKDKGKKMESEMSFFQHLEALRWHLIRAGLAILVVAIVAFANFNFIFNGIILAPTKTNFWTYRIMCEFGGWLHSLSSFFDAKSFCVEAISVSLMNTEMAGQFNLQLSLSIMTGFIVGVPYLLYEIWRFVRPALHDKERKAASGFVFYSSCLFALGVMFGYYVVTPLSIRFFAGYTVSDQIKNLFAIDSYVSSVTWLTLLAGIVFQLPIVVYILSSLGILTPKFMRSKRRYSTIIILVLAAVITPSPDALTMLIVALPLFVLYEFSIMISAIVVRKKLKREQEEANA